LEIIQFIELFSFTLYSVFSDDALDSRFLINVASQIPHLLPNQVVLDVINRCARNNTRYNCYVTRKFARYQI